MYVKSVWLLGLLAIFLLFSDSYVSFLTKWIYKCVGLNAHAWYGLCYFWVYQNNLENSSFMPPSLQSWRPYEESQLHINVQCHARDLSNSAIRHLNLQATGRSLRYINIDRTYAKYGFFKFLIDTGHILVKLYKWIPLFNINDTVVLNRISANNPVDTIGSYTITLSIDSQSFLSKSHILNQVTKLPFDGILGEGILKQDLLITNLKLYPLLLLTVNYR